MSFNRPNGNSGNTDRVDVEKLGRGKFKGRLVAVAGLGRFPNEYMGEKKPDVDKMALCIEVPGNPVDFGKGEEPRRLWVSPFNFFSTLTAKGNELKYYKAFDEFAEENEVPQWDKQLGKAVYIIVKPSGKEGGEQYDNISSLAAMDEDIAANVPEAETPLVIDDVASNESLEKMLFGLAQWQYGQTKAEDEPNTSQQSAQAQARTNGYDDSYDDDIPF